MNNFTNKINETPMGSLISPLFADIVMGALEVDCLKNLKHKHNIVLPFYFRYVNDILMFKKTFL